MDDLGLAHVVASCMVPCRCSPKESKRPDKVSYLWLCSRRRASVPRAQGLTPDLLSARSQRFADHSSRNDSGGGMVRGMGRTQCRLTLPPLLVATAPPRRGTQSTFGARRTARDGPSSILISHSQPWQPLINLQAVRGAILACVCFCPLPTHGLPTCHL